MFISAYRVGLTKPWADSTATSKVQHWPLRPPTALPTARADARLSPPSRPYLSEAHCSVFGRLGYSLGFWVLVKELPLFLFFFSPHHINANSYVPAVFQICIKLTLFVFGFVFLFKKKRNSEGCHVCPPCFMQTGCHFTTSATFWALSVCLQCFGCDTKSKKGGGGDVSIASERLRYPWVSNPPLLVPSTSLVC